MVVKYIEKRLEERQSLVNFMEKAANALQEKSLENTKENEFGWGIFVGGVYQAV